MKIVLVLDGERREVEVDLDRRTVRVGAREWPVQVGSATEDAVSFEILGERLEVRRDRTGDGTAAEPIAINGELHTLLVEARAGTRPALATERASGAVSASRAASAVARAATGPGHAVIPPMPGKVLGVLVHEGETVRAGQVLLVLEAMKMRNEVTAPVAGVVSGLAVSAGANVGAHEVLLRVVPP